MKFPPPPPPYFGEISQPKKKTLPIDHGKHNNSKRRKKKLFFWKNKNKIRSFFLPWFCEFCDVTILAKSTRGNRQIWPQVREENRKFEGSCYILATC
jgi:hypothetical protein